LSLVFQLRRSLEHAYFVLVVFAFRLHFVSINSRR
jgi:hypothetical protein